MTEVYAVLYTEARTPDAFRVLNRRGYRLQHEKDKVDPESPAFVSLTRAGLANMGDVSGILLRRAYRETVRKAPHTDFRRQLCMRAPQSVLFHAEPSRSEADLEKAVYLMSVVARPLIDEDVAAYLVLETSSSMPELFFGINPRLDVKALHTDNVTGLVNY